MDWTDLEMFMRALEGCHGGLVHVILTPAGISSSGGVSVTVSHALPCLPGVEADQPTEVTLRYPNSFGKGMIETVYDLLWKLDWRIGERYKQHTLQNG